MKKIAIIASIGLLVVAFGWLTGFWTSDVYWFAVAGAALGWGTDVIAIDMLFRKWLRWGGVIKEGYKEFIDSMSRMVEKDLINAKTLKDKLQSDRFKQALSVCVGDIIGNELPKNSGNICFEDIPGADQSVENIASLIEKIQPPIISGVYDALSDVELKSVLSEKQYEYFINANVRKVFYNKDEIERKIQSALYSFLQDKPLNAIISNAAIDQVADNLCAIITNLDLSAFDKDLDQAFSGLFTEIKIDALFDKLQKELLRMKFSDFVNDSQHLLQELLKVARSEDGRRALSLIIENVIEEAKKITVRLEDILEPSIYTGIMEFCSQKMPPIIERIIRIVRENSGEIEEMINEAVDRQLDKSAIGTLIKLIKDLFIENLAKKYSFVEKLIIPFLQESTDNAGEKLSGQMIKFIKTSTIGEIVRSVANSGLINVPFFVEIIYKNLKKLENKEYNFIDEFLKKRIGDPFPSIDLSYLKTLLTPKLFDAFKRSYLYTDEFKKWANGRIAAKAAEWPEKSVLELFGIDNIPIAIDEEKIKTRLLGSWDWVSERKVRDILGSGAPTRAIGKQGLEHFWLERKKHKLSEAYSIFKNAALYDKISEFFVQKVLVPLLPGNVSNMANRELSKQSPDDINKMVHAFMGKKLQPITIIGGIIGLITGAASGLLPLSHGSFNSSIFYIVIVLAIGLVSYSLIFALVGIGTNWVAIRMLFKPYRPCINLWPFNKWPPFVGLMVANKPEIATGIADFVSTNMLKSDAIKEDFVAEKSSIKNFVSEKVQGDDHAIIDTLLNNEQKSWASALYGMFKSHVTKRSEKTATAIANLIKTLVKEGKLCDKLRDAAMPAIKRVDAATILTALINREARDQNQRVLKTIVNALSSDAQLKKILGSDIIQNLSDKITLDNAKKLICGQNDQFAAFIENHCLEDWLGKDTVNDLTQTADSVAMSVVNPVIDALISLLKNSLHPDQKLGQAFDGKLYKLALDNISFIIDGLSKEVGNYKKEITDSIVNSMPFLLKHTAGRYVKPIVTDLLDVEFPKFLRRKQGEIERIVHDVSESKLSELGFSDASLNMANLRKSISSILESPYAKVALSHLWTIVVKQLSNLPLKSLLSVINVHNIKDLAHIAAPLISVTADHVRDNIATAAVQDTLVRECRGIIAKLPQTVTLGALLNKVELKNELHKMLQTVTADKNVIETATAILEDAINAIFRDPEFYDDTALKTDLANFLQNSEECLEKLSHPAQAAISEFLSRINAALTAETKNFCLNEATTATLNSVEHHVSNIINTLDINEVVEREINNMPPEKIRNLFYSFAEEYFGKITLYGWIAGIGGAATYGILALIRYFTHG